MSNGKATASFFENGTTAQFEYCYKLYPQVLKLKAEKRCKKPQELIRLDHWYQNDLPKLIKARGKDAHMVYDELVQTMKWKQSRGKFYPQLSYLVKVNTPRAVVQETKKAFRKLPNLEQAITALSNLKGVGTTMASALLAAAAPDSAPFMADECLMAIPEIEGIDYTTKEYLNFVQHIQVTVQRLNTEVGIVGETPKWSPHRVELALWAHYVANDLNPELLDEMPGPGAAVSTVSAKINGSLSKNEDSDKALDGEDTNDGDDESLGAAGRNTATESETENENTNPAGNLAAVNSTISNNNIDGDSNFISNDSTSQEPILDENTTQTTATTSTIDDGEVIGTPLASDSESNLEAPLKANHNTVDTTAAVVESAVAATNATTIVMGSNATAMQQETLPSKKINSKMSSSAANVAGTNKAAAANATVAANGNGTLLNVNSDHENSNCLPPSTSVNEEHPSDLDDDDEDDDDDDIDESSNSRERIIIAKTSQPKLSSANTSVGVGSLDDNDSTLSSGGTGCGSGFASTAIGQKRSALHCGIDAGGGGGGGNVGVGVDVAAADNIADDASRQPELKKLRSD